MSITKPTITSRATGDDRNTKRRPRSLKAYLRAQLPLDVQQWIADFPHPAERSHQLAALRLPEIGALVLGVHPEKLALVAESVEPEAGVRMINSVTYRRAVDILDRVSDYRAADLLRETPGDNAQALLAEMAQPRAQTISKLLQFERGTAGGNMTPSVLRAPIRDTAAATLERIREAAKCVDVASYVYLEDGDGVLVGVVSLRELVTIDPRTHLVDAAQMAINTVTPETDQEETAQLIADFDLHAIPVVSGGKLIGVVTAERASDIMEDEITEDFTRMSSSAGMSESVVTASIGKLFRSRVTWLVLLVFGNIFSGMGIAHYEELIEGMVALVFFLPLLIDSGGNAGSQSATLMVRALAIGDVKLNDWWRCLSKEFAVALLLGGAMAVAVSVLGIFRGGTILAVVVALSMLIIVIVGCIIGMSLPFLLAKLKLAPASASAPLITSICDGLGVLIYFYIASQLIL